MESNDARPIEDILDYCKEDEKIWKLAPIAVESYLRGYYAAWNNDLDLKYMRKVEKILDRLRKGERSLQLYEYIMEIK